MQVMPLFIISTLAGAIGSLSQTAVNAMLPGIMSDFGMSVDVGQWLTTIYMLVIGITVPITTYFARRFSGKRHVLIALVLFLTGSLIDSFAGSFVAMVIGRVIQAIASGLLMPLMQTIAMTRFPKGRRGTMMGIAGIAMGFAPNIGPTIGGAMIYSLGWRSFFYLLTALSVLLLIAALVLIRDEGPAARDARLDVISFMFSTLGFGGLLLGISNASSFELTSLFIWLPVLFGIVMLLLFILRQRRVENPLVNLSIFSSRRFVTGFVALNLMFASFMGVTLVVPLYVETLCGGTSLDAGMVLLPGTIAALILNPLSGALTDRIGTRPVVIVAGALFAIGSVSMSFVDESTPLALLTCLQAIRACGVSGLMPALISWSLSDLPPRTVADGSSFGLAVRQVCASLGTSGMVLAISLVSSLAVDPALAYQAAFMVSALFALATFVCIVGFLR